MRSYELAVDGNFIQNADHAMRRPSPQDNGMYDLVSIAWLIISGLLEPVWLFAMVKSDNFKNRFYGTIAVIAMFASPLCLSMSLDSFPIGIAYALWTGMGAVFAVAFGALLFKERVTKRTVFYASLVIIGAVCLALEVGA